MNAALPIRKATEIDYPRIMEIWESAVLATHNFLDPNDFQLFKTLIPTSFLPQLEVYVWDEGQHIPAYFAISEDNLEMLFVDAKERGKGFGKKLVQYVIHELGVLKVDVNEQNEQAVAFYHRMGYRSIGRSEKDGMGKPYPLLYLLFDKA